MRDIFYNNETLEGVDHLSGIMENLLVKEPSSLNLDEIVFKNDFLKTPSLYAYFNQKVKTSTIEQIYLGVIKASACKVNIEVKSDSKGHIYIPRLFILKVEKTLESFTLKYKDNNNFQLTDINGNEVFFKKIPLEIIYDDIELCHIEMDILNDVLNLSKAADLSAKFSPNIIKHKQEIIDAVEFIKKLDLIQYSEVKDYVKVIALLNADNLIAFTAIDLNGVIFINEKDGSDYYLDHIIHEVSHIKLNYVFTNLVKYFAINPMEESFKSPFKSQNRGVYHVFHAAYVLSKLIQFYEKCITQQIYPNGDQISCVGRYVLAMNRLSIALESIGNKDIYTERGYELFSVMHEIFIENKVLHRNLLKKYKVSDQAIEFSKQIFCKENKISISDNLLVPASLV